MSDRNRFDKFTQRARKVLSLAQEEAQRFQHNYIGTEHLLLGLVREGEGVAAKVLSNLGVELNEVRSTVESIIGRGDRIVLGEIGLTPRSKKAIELAVDEARRLNHHYIGTEHMLLGLVREGEGIAAGVLESMGVDLEKVRTQTMQVLSQSGDASAPRGRSASHHTVVSQGDEEGMQKDESPGGPFVPDPEDRMAATSIDALVANGRYGTFTERAGKVLGYSQEEARRFQHNYIGTEHLLLGLIHDDKGVGTHVLHNLGVSLAKVRSAVEFIIGRGDRFVLGEIGLTPRAKKVLELAADEAQRMNQPYIGTGHILLGLVREGEGIAAGVLESLGVNMGRVRAQTTSLLQQE